TGTYPNPTLGTSGVSSGSYGNATQVAQFVVDAKGRITSATNVGIEATPVGAAAGDLTGTYPNPMLATSGVTSGSYGNTTQVAQFVVDAKGRVTSATNVTISGVAPAGAAAGDLTGTYPNPTLATSQTGAHTWSGSQTFTGAVNVTTSGQDILISSYKPAGAPGYNIFIGGGGQSSSYTVSSQGSYNSFFGVSAGFYNTTGNSNTALGVLALRYNTTGTNNTAVGGDAMLGVSGQSSGDNNSAFGVSALSSITTGDNNVALGNQALAGNTAGSLNSAMGMYALIYNTAGSNNLALGYASGMYYGTGTGQNTAPTNSVYIGADARPAADAETNEIVIGYAARGNGSNSATLGNSSITKTVLYGSVGIGTTAPTANALDVTGSGSNTGIRVAAGVPTNTTAALYNNGGTLYWNGSQVGGPPTGSAAGDLTGTYPNPTLATSGVTSGNYGNATQVAQLTVDAKGRVTAATNVTISGVAPAGNAAGELTGTYPNPTLATAQSSAHTWSATQTFDQSIVGSITGNAATVTNGIYTTTSAAGDLTGTYPNPTLATSGVTSGSYGNTTQVAQLTVDAKGRVTAATNVTISGVAPAGSAAGELTGTYPNPTLATAQSSAHTWSATQTFSQSIIGSITGNAATVTNGIYTTTSAAGDLTGTYPNPTLATSGVTSGSYGNTTQVAQLLVDAKGRITSATNVTISGVAPAGSAAGDLTGTYPNPTLATSQTGAHTWSGSQTFTGAVNVTTSGQAVLISSYKPSGASGWNIFIGGGGQSSSYTSGTEGSYNSFFGMQAGYSNTSGSFNNAIGYTALYQNTTGTGNIAVGSAALYANADGAYNTALGVNTLHANVSGLYNVAVGYGALSDNTAHRNTGTGVGALEHNTGSYNTSTGMWAMRGLSGQSTGSNNTANGYAALYGNTTGNYNAAVGYSALLYNTTGSYNTATGMYAMQGVSGQSTGNDNSAYGYAALYGNTTGADNAAIGRGALYTNSTGARNTAIGKNALYSNDTASYNTAVGYHALYNNIYYDAVGGQSNTALGYYALTNNSTGGRNTATGYSALGGSATPANNTGSSNSAYGYQAMTLNSSGSSNAAYGYQALYSNGTGSNNTAIGVNAGMYVGTGSTQNTSPSNSVYLGYDARPAADSESNEIVIGYTARGNGSDSATLGNSSITKTVLYGSVGIGTTAPTANALDVTGSGSNTGIRVAAGVPTNTTAALYNNGGTLYWN
ncbi:MAG: hypothetical protein WC421_11730, partial [Elusimicrobiales bacterium]